MSALQNYIDRAGMVGSELSSEAMGQFESRKEEFSLENAYDDITTQQTQLKAQEGETIGMASEGGAKAVYYGRKLYKTFANNDVAKKYASKMADSLLGEENSKALQQAVKGGQEAINAFKGGDVSKLISGLKSGDSDAIGTIKGLLPEGSDISAGLEAGDKSAVEGVSQLLSSLSDKSGKIVSGAKNVIQNNADTGDSLLSNVTGQARNAVDGALESARSNLGDAVTNITKAPPKVSFADEAETFSYNPRSRIVSRKAQQEATKQGKADDDTSWLDDAPKAEPKLSTGLESAPADLTAPVEVDAITGKPIQAPEPPKEEEFDPDLPEEAGFKEGVFQGRETGGIPQSDAPKVSTTEGIPDAPPSLSERSMTEVGADPESNPFSFESQTGIGGGQTRANLQSLFPEQPEAGNVSFQFQRPVQPPPRPAPEPQQIQPTDIQQGRFVGDESQGARDALAKAMGKDRTANEGNVEATDEPEIKLANPFEDPEEVSKYAGVDKYGYERAETDLPTDGSYVPPKPVQVSGEEIPNPAFNPDQDLRPDPNLRLQPQTELDQPLKSSLKSPAELNPEADASDPLTDALSGGGKAIADVAEQGGKMIADEGISIGSKLLGIGGTFLDALGPLGDLAMLGSMAYSAFTEKDEGAEMLNQGNKIHAQLVQMGQGASVSEGSLAGASLDTLPQSVGATFPHF